MDHDALFKSLLTEFFADFLRLFYPNKATRLDLRRPRFLDKEVFADLPKRKERRLDLVAEVPTRGGRKEIVLVHVEIEARGRERFEARMFRYYMALRLRHDQPVFPIVLVLSRAAAGLDRPSHREAVLGEEVCAFRFWRIGLSRLSGAEYVSRANPLAPALAALMRPGSRARDEWKERCLRAVASARTNEARRTLLLDCIESYLPLSPTEEARFHRRLEHRENKELMAMRKTWSEQLLERGERRGEKRARRETLLRLMGAKFGTLPADVETRVAAIEDIARLDVLLERILTAHSIDEMGLA